MEKIKVLIVAADPAVGMIPFVVTIANTLADDDRFEVHALVVDKEEMSYSDKFCKNVRVKAVSKPDSSLGKLLFKIYPVKLFNLLEGLICEIKPEIVHFMVGEFLFANHIKNVKPESSLCLTVHDLHPHERNKQSIKDGLIYKEIIHKGYKKCESFIPTLTTSSLSQYKELKELYPSKNIIFTHFPSLVTEQIKHGRAEVKELLGIEKYILFFGSVDKYKGVDLLISAFCSLKNNCGMKLVIAGKGQDYDTSDNKDIIRLNRFIEDEEVGDLFRRASFVVYPYISATMSGVLSIAYYFRKRVLMSDVQFFKDNATPSCTLFRAGDKEDLKNKLQELLNSKDCEPTKDFYSDMYSHTVLSDDYFNLYKSIIINASKL